MAKKNNKDSLIGQTKDLIEEIILNKGKKEEFSKRFDELIVNKINGLKE
ncbi:MAG: hypothetical protein ACFFDF_23680 [Candidatus Odinarchaeota archaeon]